MQSTLDKLTDEIYPIEEGTNPEHYQMASIEVWDFIADQDLDFFSGNIIKYVPGWYEAWESRLDDLIKAQMHTSRNYRIRPTNELRKLPRRPHLPPGDGPAHSVADTASTR